MPILILKADIGERYQRLLQRRTGGDPAAMAAEDRQLTLRAHAAFDAVDHQATPAQREAGNYRKHHVRFQGLDVTIENPRGSIRRGVDRGGHEWATSMRHDYGYIRGTLGVDGDHFDVLLGPNQAAPMAYVVTTMAPPEFTAVDEQKALLGFSSEEEAKAAFLGMYDDPRFLGALRAVPVEEFKRQVQTTRESPRLLFLKGGEGSGNHGHAGRPGMVGGSAPHTTAPALPSSAGIASANEARDYWRSHFAGRTLTLHVRVKSGTYPVEVRFDDANTHMWTRSARPGEEPDAYDRPKGKAGPRVFDPQRAALMDRMFTTIERPWKVFGHGVSNIYLGTRLPSGGVYTVVLEVDAPGRCTFASAYPRSKGEIGNLVRNGIPALPAGLKPMRKSETPADEGGGSNPGLGALRGNPLSWPALLLVALPSSRFTKGISAPAPVEATINMARFFAAIKDLPPGVVTATVSRPDGDGAKDALPADAPAAGQDSPPPWTHDDFDSAASRLAAENGGAFSAAELAARWHGRTEEDALDMLHARHDDYAVMPDGERWMPMAEYLRSADPVEMLR